jgi:hypothetical protein
MPLGVDERLHIIGVEVEVFVVRSNDVGEASVRKWKKPCSLIFA